MIYIDATELGWRTYTESWVTAKFKNDEESKVFHRDLFEKWLPKLLKFKDNNCHEPVKGSEFCAVVSLCALYDALCKAETGFRKDALGADYNAIAEKLFVFALTWSVGASVDEGGRKKVRKFLKITIQLFKVVQQLFTTIDKFLPPRHRRGIPRRQYCLRLLRGYFKKRFDWMGCESTDLASSEVDDFPRYDRYVHCS